MTRLFFVISGCSAVLALGLGADALAAAVGAFTAGLLEYLINR
ncbi:hypothetical protein [Nonomuraea guangzhouensis]|uniref:Uncharacterized protein n=1 Tax=Nonomuraea guangzhouensis TaxID=1291555 RepID=A0ABW4GQW6_9ACTN|nr:hypothetical protein [Nonomuraea guangzhouensis]